MEQERTVNTDDVVNWLLDEAETILTQTNADGITNVSTPAEHVDQTDAHDETTYPFIGVRILAAPTNTAGIGNGNLGVDSSNYSDGSIDSVTYYLERDARFEVIPVTDGNPQLRDQLADAVTRHFSVRSRQYPENVPTDIDSLSVGASTPTARTGEHVRESGVELGLPYTEYVTKSVPAAESVTTTVEESDDLITIFEQTV